MSRSRMGIAPEWIGSAWRASLGESRRGRALRGGGSRLGAMALVAALATSGEPTLPLASAGTAAWPESREGQLARGWVESFDAGEPAMRKFLAENLAAASLATKGVEERLVTYRALRERLGLLNLAAVVEERPGAIDVSLADAKGTEHEFTFELESDPPRKLRAVTAKLVETGHSIFPH